MELYVLSVKPTKEDRNYIDIKIRKIPGNIARFFGAVVKEITYRGGGTTVWHELPSHKRAGVNMEFFLSNQYLKARLNKKIDYS